MSAISLRGVGKAFGSTPVLADVDLDVADGSMTAILGASGSGKTTLLRLVAGFEDIDSGSITVGGVVMDDTHRRVSSQHRGVGFVPQEAALFPHLTVRGNVGFGVARRDRDRVEELIDLVGLGGMERRFPHQLSGGQQQRVALARALAIRPKVVLLDEPFSSLDAALRVGLRRDVARILAETGTTTIIVTHDQDEALGMADQIAVLRAGRVVATGDPRSLYAEPPDTLAATSVGEANILPATLVGGRALCELGDLKADVDGEDVPDGPGRLLLRPEQLLVHLGAAADATAAVVVDCQYHGHDALLEVAVGDASGRRLLARVPGSLVITPGQAVWIEVQGPARAWGDEAGDQALRD
jgi:iron(III) transport system ATP-binding protein